MKTKKVCTDLDNKAWSKRINNPKFGCRKINFCAFALNHSFPNKLIFSVQFPLLRMDSASPKKEEVNFSFVYIAHPRAVTGFSWRKTSKHMPK